VCDHITTCIHWNLTRNPVKECLKPHNHTQTQKHHHQLIALDMAYTFIIKMQAFLQADWLQRHRHWVIVLVYTTQAE